MGNLAAAGPFRPGEVWGGCEYLGDAQAGQARAGHVQAAIQALKCANVQNLEVYQHVLAFDDGTRVTVRRRFNVYSAEVFVPPREGLRSDQFYWVPGCVARYGFSEKSYLRNEIPHEDDDWSGSISETNLVFSSAKEAGLPASGTSPGGFVSRRYRAAALPGFGPDVGYLGSQLRFSMDHLPRSGPFSVSCLVRLREPIQMDSSFQYRTDELRNGYTVWNPIKARLLTSKDGETWYAVCPGSIAPLLGCFVPSRFSDHWVNFSGPWNTYNKDFVSSVEKRIGYREIYSACPKEPLLESPYDSASPYWDKVAVDALESLSGAFLASWSENGETQNAAPFASFCTFKVQGSHEKPVGTRVVGTLSTGEKRYATVFDMEREFNADGSTRSVTFTLKDHQHKKYISESLTSLQFGKQPFPFSHQNGYTMGMNVMGLFWVNGNKIAAGKLCDFQKEYQLKVIESHAIDINVWHHVCMTFGRDGTTKLYTTPLLGKKTSQFASVCSTGLFPVEGEFGDVLQLVSGSDGWVVSPGKGSSPETFSSQWEYASNMDIALPRFYRRALTSSEVELLAGEAFGGVFVADDHEARALIAKGLRPVVV